MQELSLGRILILHFWQRNGAPGSDQMAVARDLESNGQPVLPRLRFLMIAFSEQHDARQGPECVMSFDLDVHVLLSWRYVEVRNESKCGERNVKLVPL